MGEDKAPADLVLEELKVDEYDAIVFVGSLKSILEIRSGRSLVRGFTRARAGRPVGKP